MTPIRIAVYVDEPYSFDCFELFPSTKCLKPGYEVEYIDTVIRGVLKLPIKWIRVNSSKDMERALDSFQADIGGLSMPVNTSFIKQWGFPPPNYLHDNIAFVAREINVGNAKYFGLLRAFTWDLWVAIALFSMATFFARWASKQIQNKNSNSDTSSIWPPAKLYSKFVYFVRANLCYSLWFVFLSFLLNFYSNLIAVDLVRPNTIKDVGFSSMQDLGEKLVQNKCRLVTLKQYKTDAEFEDYVLNPTKSNKPWAHLFIKANRYNKPLYANNRSHLVDLVKTDLCTIGLDYGSMDTYYLTHYCDLKIITKSDDLPLMGYTFYTTKESIKESMSTVIASLPFQSYPTYLSQRYLSNPTPPVCASNRSVSETDVILTMEKVQDCFYILLIGLFIALTVALLQKCRLQGQTRNYNF